MIVCGVGCASGPSARTPAVPSHRTGRNAYVGTPDTGDDSDRRDRQQAVIAVRAALVRSHDHFVLVDSPAEADIAVTIVERVIADSKSSLSLIPPRYYAARSIVRLRATVTRQSESADLVGGKWREDNAEGWKLAAQDLVEAIGVWMRGN